MQTEKNLLKFTAISYKGLAFRKKANTKNARRYHFGTANNDFRHYKGQHLNTHSIIYKRLAARLTTAIFYKPRAQRRSLVVVVKKHRVAVVNNNENRVQPTKSIANDSPFRQSVVNSDLSGQHNPGFSNPEPLTVFGKDLSHCQKFSTPTQAAHIREESAQAGSFANLLHTQMSFGEQELMRESDQHLRINSNTASLISAYGHSAPIQRLRRCQSSVPIPPPYSFPSSPLPSVGTPTVQSHSNTNSNSNTSSPSRNNNRAGATTTSNSSPGKHFTLGSGSPSPYGSPCSCSPLSMSPPQITAFCHHSHYQSQPGIRRGSFEGSQQDTPTSISFHSTPLISQHNSSSNSSSPEGSPRSQLRILLLVQDYRDISDTLLPLVKRKLRVALQQNQPNGIFASSNAGNGSSSNRNSNGASTLPPSATPIRLLVCEINSDAQINIALVSTQPHIVITFSNYWTRLLFANLSSERIVPMQDIRSLQGNLLPLQLHQRTVYFYGLYYEPAELDRLSAFTATSTDITTTSQGIQQQQQQQQQQQEQLASINEDFMSSETPTIYKMLAELEKLGTYLASLCEDQTRLSAFLASQQQVSVNTINTATTTTVTTTTTTAAFFSPMQIQQLSTTSDVAINTDT